MLKSAMFVSGSLMLGACATLSPSPTYDFAAHSCELLQSELRVAEMNVKVVTEGTPFAGSPSVPDGAMASVQDPQSLASAGIGGPYKAGDLKRASEARLSRAQLEQDAVSARDQVMAAMEAKRCPTVI